MQIAATTAPTTGNFVRSPKPEKVRALYAAMDERYTAAATHYGFHCTGCEENCCLTRFHHHTFLEYLYLLEGYRGLEPERQRDIREKASDVCERTAEADVKGLPVRLMCPLNSDGLCLLYAYRPMICRLHGLPFELHRPGGNVINSSGCDAFTVQCGEKAYFQMDRTPFYREMAMLEQEVREALGVTRKLKMTIAEMLV